MEDLEKEGMMLYLGEHQAIIDVRMKHGDDCMGTIIECLYSDDIDRPPKDYEYNEDDEDVDDIDYESVFRNICKSKSGELYACESVRVIGYHFDDLISTWFKKINNINDVDWPEE